MEKPEVIKALQDARQNAKKRKFSQSVDLVINLKGINLKKEEEKVNTFLTLPHERGKKVRVTALVGQELMTKAKAACNQVVMDDKFASLEKKDIRKIAAQSDFFIAQANIMTKIASTFGKVLGPRGLMPNPKAGCVVAPASDLKVVIEKLQKTVRLETKNEPTVKVPVGSEAMKDEEIADNVLAVYNTILAGLPQERANIKSVVLKLTMGKPVFLGEKQQPVEEKVEEKIQEKKQAPKKVEEKLQEKKETKKKQQKTKEKIKALKVKAVEGKK